jgi:hypothetical protein
VCHRHVGTAFKQTNVQQFKTQNISLPFIPRSTSTLEEVHYCIQVVTGKENYKITRHGTVIDALALLNSGAEPNVLAVPLVPQGQERDHSAHSVRSHETFPRFFRSSLLPRLHV